MKRKLVTLLITLIVIMSSSLPAGAAQTKGMNSFFEILEEISFEERESYITLLTPLLMVDSGIDDLINTVTNYQPGKTDTLINKYIGELLKYTEKEIIINTLESVKATDITARRAFLEALRYKKSITISAKTKTAVISLLSFIYSEVPSLESLLKDGGYSEEIVANLIKCAVGINGSNALYVFDGNVFSEGEVYSVLDSNIKNIWSGHVVTEKGIEKRDDNVFGEDISLSNALIDSASLLNTHIVPEKRKLIAEGLSQIGLVKIVDNKNQDSSEGQGENNDQTPEQLMPDKEVIITLKDGETKTVSFETEMKRPVLYKKEGEKLTLIKHSALHDGKLIAKVTEGGTYLIRELPQKFTDCDGWAKNYIEMLAARGIINGKAENLYMPSDTITREEFVKLIVELLDITKSETESVFDDVGKDAWYAVYVNTAYENKIINGMNETQFGVGMPIKRQDMAKIINTVLKTKGIKSSPEDETVFVDYKDIAEYAKGHVLSIYNLGIISGDENKNFNPNSFATRAEAAKMVYGMLVQLIIN